MNILRSLLIAGLLGLCVAVPLHAQQPETPPAVEAPEVVEAPPAIEAEDPNPDPDVRSHQHSVVSVGDDSTLAAGENAAAVVSVFGSSTSEGNVDQAVVSVFGDTRATGTVGNAVVAVLGDVYVNNYVGDAVVAVLGNVELGPEANVEEVVVIGGTLTRADTAVVRGGVQRILTSEFRGLRFLRPWTRHALLLGRPLAIEPGLGWAWGFAFGFLALYVGLALLFRDGVDRCVETLETRPGQSVLAAILATLLTPVLMMVLLVSVLGIAAIPFVILALIGACLFGKAVVLAWIGKRGTKFFASSPLGHTAVAVLVGGLIVMALYLVPFVGFVLFNAIGVLGLGVVIYTLLLSVQGARRARVAAAPSQPPPAAGAASSGFAEATGQPGAGAPASGFAEGADQPGAGASASGFAGAAGQPGAGASGSAGPTGAPHAEFASASQEPPRAAPPPPDQAARPAAAAVMSDAEAAALPRATFWMRMGALAIDVVMIGILVGMLNQDGDLFLLLLATYGALMWKFKGTTIGGVVLGLKVVRRDGRPIDWATTIVRALSCFLSLFVVGLGFIWIIFDDEKQGWHDKIAGTVVVTMPKGVSLL
jgi:uncharacterized RDD family membrane protein YckC